MIVIYCRQRLMSKKVHNPFYNTTVVIFPLSKLLCIDILFPFRIPKNF